MSTAMARPPSPAPVPIRTAPPPPPRPRPPRRRDRGTRWRTGLAISVLVHVLLFAWLYRTYVSTPEIGERQPAALRPDEVGGGMRIVRIEAVPGDVAPLTPLAPAASPRVSVSSRAPGVAVPRPGVPTEPQGVGPRRDVLEPLRPKAGDPRLWVSPDLLTPAQTPEERMAERIAGRIDAYNDSLAAASEAARRALDWTVKGKNGARWGIAPDGIHLGKITLPAPTFGGNAEARARNREWSQIQDQASRAEIHDRFKDRVKAIEERKDRERAARKKAGSGSGSDGSGHGP